MTDAERGVLVARRHAVVARLDSAEPAWRAWAEVELDRVPHAVGVDARDGRYDAVRDTSERERLGQVFTPDPVAAALAAFARTDRPGRVLDPAVGDGSLLRAVAYGRFAQGTPAGSVLDALTGWDIDGTALALARLGLVAWGLDVGTGPAPGPLDLAVRDALEPGGGPFAHIVSNPPYLEAKRMNRAQPGLKERLRERFPQLGGAFDLWLAFAWRALELCPEGSIALLLPNRVLQGRYAAAFREEVHRQGRLAGVFDLASMKPRAFPGTGVYPVIAHLERTARIRVGRVDRAEELSRPVVRELPVEALDVGGERPWFVPFPTWPALLPLFRRSAGGAAGFALPRLGDVAAVRSTCSFHARGLRERFVTPTEPSQRAFPYVGGASRARENEVGCFQIRWAGWWIDYDEETLRAEGNPLPPLSVFQRPKVIFNQHDRRMSPCADPEGRWVTKDVVPVAWPEHPDWTLGRLTAVLASTVFTALYNTLYQGVVVGGETYHYLPAFLRHVPVPPGDHPDLDDADARVAALHARFDPVAWDALDAAVARAYGVSEADRQAMIDVHLRRVGAPHPSGGLSAGRG